MEEKKTSLIYRIIRWLVWLFSPNLTLVGEEKLPDGPCVIIGNHSQMAGPIAGELYFPGNRYIWCAGEMMNRKEVAEYAFTDFWSFKPKWTHPFFRLLSHLIVPLSVCVFNNAHTVPVYHDARLITTFRESVALLQKGVRLIIFPEKNQRYNNIVYAFQDKFIDVARFYFKRTGESLPFVPMYIAPRLRKMYLGEPILFDPQAPIDSERERICREAAEQITRIAASLPEHTVVPYRNIPRKDYPKNKPIEVYQK